jgi:hypothetical protein
MPIMQITIEDDVCENYRLYAELRHVSVKSAINFALKDWMESVGRGHMEYVAGNERSKALN